MKACFSTMFEDVRRKRSLTIIFSIRDPDVMKQSRFTDDKKNN